MNGIEKILANNREWSRRMTEHQSDYFQKLAAQQAPDYLWIGCSDSRVPANEIVGLLPGELFVHRNVANIVYPADLNCLSVVEFAVDVLKVKEIIVCGHYGCGGVKAALDRLSHGLIDNWLTKIKDVYVRNDEEIDSLKTEEERVNRMCELNVIEQVKALSHTAIVQDAWRRRQQLNIHGWIYGLQDGLITDLGVRVSQVSQVAAPFRFAEKRRDVLTSHVKAGRGSDRETRSKNKKK
ncbi:MAG TPA: carbonate dehydratase [Chthoniobacterales bacterium]|nr:carbonate dehydratase [Chthoniobacterales bacterium]